MALLLDPALDIRQYLENLVRIAVGFAQQAEDMSFEARKANRKTRRSMLVVAGFGALGLMVGIAAFTASRSANVRLSEFRDKLSALHNMGQDIASLQQQRKEEEAALTRQKADHQAMREALQQQIADLQQQAKSLQDEVARRSRDLEPASTETNKLRQNLEALSPATSPAQEASAADQQGGRAALQHQIADLPLPAKSLQDHAARRSDDLEATRTRTGKLRQDLEAAHTQTEKIRQDTEPLQQQRKAEQGAFARQKRHEQQMTVLPPPLPSEPPLNPVSSATQPIPVFMPGLRASQQLLIAREWLVTGRLDQARRVLAMVQTQLVLHPVDPHQATVQDVNALATDVGNAIRWLDMGANGQAMQALNQAMHKAGAN